MTVRRKPGLCCSGCKSSPVPYAGPGACSAWVMPSEGLCGDCRPESEPIQLDLFGEVDAALRAGTYAAE